ncbi:SAVED domain-containing protein [Exiguobacterium sp. s154]|uniref:SAVED domain-containing protein n=1 Tax=Exiguobacterium sp. s154 TaxID=2751277 RepID=UPI001BE62C7B|nr:SAVED domain-containing protein [Exiguobacterium sp. s154]
MEKIDLKGFLKRIFSGFFEKKIVWLLITSGIALTMYGIFPDVWRILAIQLLNAFYNLSLNETPEKISWGLRLFLTATGAALIVSGLWFYFKTRENIKLKKLLQIAHSSIESVEYSKFDVDLDNYEVEQYRIAQGEELKTLSKVNLSHALREQGKIKEKILQRADGRDNVEASYWGLAHIPLTFLMGYQIADKLSTSFFEWNQNSLSWNRVKDNNTEYPELLVSRQLNQSFEDVEDVVIKIGITYQVEDVTLNGLGLEGRDSYYLHLPSPTRNAIVSVRQLNEYQAVFRKTMDEINQYYPSLKRVHVFYSGQPSLAYRLGSCLSPRMDKEILVYNYHSTSEPKYNWSINMKKEWNEVAIHVTGETI